MPVWHEATQQLVDDGKLVVLGITQEQHPERCQLFAQWKQLDWPILHDPINLLESSAVPIAVAIDEHGIVRSVRPQPQNFEETFVNQLFADDAVGDPQPGRYGPEYPPDFEQLHSSALSSDSSQNWRELADALLLWGGPERVNESIDAYTAAVQADSQDARSFFRRGVAFRERYESDAREPNDFQAAIDDWGRALALNSNQYIWRRRIQQYGPRLDKPYPFYDWVAEAERAIRNRGERPVQLPVRPDGAEIAAPAKGFDVGMAATPPDPLGKIQRIEPGAVTVEATVVPTAAAPGETARVHLVFRIDSRILHWNNEVEPLHVWLDPPEDWSVSKQLLSAELPKEAVSEEDRRIELEVKLPPTASGNETLSGYALFHVCDETGGTCRYVRQDVKIEVPVAATTADG